MKKLILSAILYVLAAMIPPVVTVLSSEIVLTERVLVVMGLSSLLAGVISLKAFMSQSIGNEARERDEPAKVVVTNDSKNPVLTEEQR